MLDMDNLRLIGSFYHISCTCRHCHLIDLLYLEEVNADAYCCGNCNEMLVTRDWRTNIFQIVGGTT